MITDECFKEFWVALQRLSSVEARLEAAEGRKGALEGIMEARASLLPDLEAVVSAAETASASAARQRAAGHACCSV